MKKTTIYFSLATALAACLFLFPSLTGSIIVDKNDKPTDFLSKLWAGDRTEFITRSYPENIRVLKIEGNGRSVNIRLGQSADDNKYFSPNPNSYKARIVKDTLIIKNSEAMYLQLHKNTKINKIVLQNTGGLIEQSEMETPVDIELHEASNVRLVLPKSENATLIKNTRIFVYNQSIASLINGSVQTLDAYVDNAELNYSNAVVIDSANVQLVGRSIVKSSAVHEAQNVKTLTVSGDKQYFKPELIGHKVELLQKD